MPLTRAGSPGDLAAALRDAEESVVTVIDSPGTAPFRAAEVGDLKRFLDAADAEPLLVLAAGGAPEEDAEAAEVYSGLGAKRFVVTRADVSRRLGGILAAADAARLAFAGISISPYVAQGIDSLNPVSLARLLLRDADAPATLTTRKAPQNECRRNPRPLRCIPPCGRAT